MVKMFCFVFYWYSKRVSCYQPALTPQGTESIRSCACSHTLLSGAVNISSVPGFSFCCSSLLSYACKSVPKSSLFPLFSINSMLLHISAVFLSSSGTQGSLQVRRHRLCFTIAREESRLPTNISKASFSPVPAGGNYCLQFQYITKVLKKLEGKERDSKLSQNVIPLSCRHPKRVDK